MSLKVISDGSGVHVTGSSNADATAEVCTLQKKFNVVQSTVVPNINILFFICTCTLLKYQVPLMRPMTESESPTSPSALASVILTALSPCGRHIAVVTWTLKDEVYGVTRAPYSELLVYSIFQASTPVPTHVMIAEGDIPPAPNPEWVCVQQVRLYELALSPTAPAKPEDLLNPPIVDDNAYMTWCADSSLVLIVPVIDKGERPCKCPFLCFSDKCTYYFPLAI